MSRNPSTVMTANGEVQTRKEATVYFEELDLLVTVILLEETPAVLSLGKLCEDHGYNYHWTSENHISPKMAGESIAKNRTTFHSLVPGLSTSSSTSLSPPSSTSSRQDSVIGTENPATERSGSMSAELRRNPLQNPVGTETQIKIKTTKKYEVECCVICRSVPAESRKNPSHEHRDTSSSSHELPMESGAKVELHSVSTVFTLTSRKTQKNPLQKIQQELKTQIKMKTTKNYGAFAT